MMNHSLNYHFTSFLWLFFVFWRYWSKGYIEALITAFFKSWKISLSCKGFSTSWSIVNTSFITLSKYKSLRLRICCWYILGKAVRNLVELFLLTKLLPCFFCFSKTLSHDFSSNLFFGFGWRGRICSLISLRTRRNISSWSSFNTTSPLSTLVLSLALNEVPERIEPSRDNVEHLMIEFCYYHSLTFCSDLTIVRGRFSFKKLAD